jgi:hypothetical protein
MDATREQSVTRHFEATDLGLVAFLQLKGLAFFVDRSGFPHKFLFDDAAMAEAWSRKYWDRSQESYLPAQAFMVALQGVKSQIFRRGQTPGRRLDIGHERSDSARFQHTKNRLRWTWSIAMTMTIILFILYAALAVIAVIAAIRTGSCSTSIVTGGASGLSFLTLVIWKPYDKAIEAAARMQRLEMILVFYEDQRKACVRIPDPVARAIQLGSAQQAACNEIERVAGVYAGG